MVPIKALAPQPGHGDFQDLPQPCRQNPERLTRVPTDGLETQEETPRAAPPRLCLSAQMDPHYTAQQTEALRNGILSKAECLAAVLNCHDNRQSG